MYKGRDLGKKVLKYFSVHRAVGMKSGAIFFAILTKLFFENCYPSRFWRLICSNNYLINNSTIKKENHESQTIQYNVLFNVLYSTCLYSLHIQYTQFVLNEELGTHRYFSMTLQRQMCFLNSA